MAYAKSGTTMTLTPLGTTPEESKVPMDFPDASIYSWLALNVHKVVHTLTETKSTSYEPLEVVFCYPKDFGSWRGKDAMGMTIESLSDDILNIKLETKVPLILIPHGGPHSSILVDWNTFHAGLLAQGYALALINYTGSVGYGERSIQTLLGKIGDLEVQQTHTVAKYLLDTYDWLDPKCVFSFGGSHGGFISAWLSVRYPNFYRGVVLANPLIDISSNQVLSDIPDWSFGELGFPFDFDRPLLPSVKEYGEMYRRSPTSRPSKDVCPTLLILCLLYTSPSPRD